MLRRQVLATGLLLPLLASLAPPASAAGGQSPLLAYQPRADHIGVVVTSGEVLMSWRRLEGMDAGTPVVRRGQGGCPQTSSDGVAAGKVEPLHIIDRTVQTGTTYCYTLFSSTAGGGVRRIGSSGLVTVPDTSVVPPATVPLPAPAPIVSAPAGSHERALVMAAGGVLGILALLLVLVGIARRVAVGRSSVRSPAREWILDRPNATVVVPAMIALGWVGLLVALVALR